MSVLTCLGCTARYSVGAPQCPQCGGTDFVTGDAVADPDLMPDQGAAEPTSDGSDPDPGPVAAPAPKAKAASKTTT